MNFLRRRSWQLALVVSGVLAAVGGSMHPEVGPEGTAREELAAMTADDAWLPGHVLLAIAVALLALGLAGALRSGRWPSAARALRFAAVAVGVYVVEAVLHAAAVVDQEALASGGAAPVAFAHLGLAAVLYPLSGAAIVWVAAALGQEWGRLRPLSYLGVVGGLVHAVSVPLTLLLVDTETSLLFASAGMLLATWTLAVGLIGLTRPRPRLGPSPREALAVS